MVVVAVLVVVWWVVPLRFSVPDSTRLTDSSTVALDRSIKPFSTTHGQLTVEGLHPWRHRWVVTLMWSRADPATGRYNGVSRRVDVAMGESVHIDGLGTVTLLAVNPQALLPGLFGVGGWTCTVGVALDPDVSEVWR